MNRSGESGSPPERNKRLFKANDYWYYKTREGIDVGPFDTRSEAQGGISQFIDFVLHADASVIESIERYSQCYQRQFKSEVSSFRSHIK